MGFVGIYPIPREIVLLDGSLSLEDATIVVSSFPSPSSIDSARILVEGIAERMKSTLKLRRISDIPYDECFIFIGEVSDFDEVRERISLPADKLVFHREGYFLAVYDRYAAIIGADPHGVFYGVQSLLQLIDNLGCSSIPSMIVRDWPYKPIRGFHLYLPSRDNVGFLVRFIKYFLAYYKFNTLFLEVGGGMRLDRHPEVNTGWMELCRDVKARGERPKGPQNRFQDSVHHELGGGGFLEKEEVKAIVEIARRYHIEVVPEIQSLTHSYYLVAAHREIAELPEADWPDSYCPSNPESYKLLFDIIDEYIEVLKPRMIHIGHDEWRAAGLCSRCRDKNTADLFAEDVTRIYEYLRSRGIEVAMWADHLIKGHNGVGRRRVSADLLVETPTTWQAAEKIPRDILMINWGSAKSPENDEELASYGFKQIYGNYSSLDFIDWPNRSRHDWILGGEVSSWVDVDERTFWRDGIIYNAFMSINDFWSIHYPDRIVKDHIFSRISRILKARLSGRDYPSLMDDREFFTIDIAGYANAPIRDEVEGYDLSHLYKVEVTERSPIPFRVSGSKDKAIVIVDRSIDSRISIRIDRRANSLIFIHASTKPGVKIYSHYASFRCPDLAVECIGLYEVIYEDGFREVIPIRYGENIAEWNDTLYDTLSDPILDYRVDGVSLYAYEWMNPYYDKVIRGIDMIGVEGLSDAKPMLVAITGVELQSYRRYFENGLGRRMCIGDRF